MTIALDKQDRDIINTLQDDFPVCNHPFARIAQQLNMNEDEIISRVRTMLDQGVLTRFGPMYNADNIGGALSLCAMKVPLGNFDDITNIVNAFPQVAHNYQREHEMNMWFVLATETQEDLTDTIREIENATGIQVYNMPKEKEYFVGLRFRV